MTLWTSALTVTTSSTPPLAPSEWPSWLLVLEMLTFWACSPKTRFHGLRLGLVAQRRAGAVGVDVADVGRIQLRVGAGRRSSRGAAPVPCSSGCVMCPASA